MKYLIMYAIIIVGFILKVYEKSDIKAEHEEPFKTSFALFKKSDSLIFEYKRNIKELDSLHKVINNY